MFYILSSWAKPTQMKSPSLTLYVRASRGLTRRRGQWVEPLNVLHSLVGRYPLWETVQSCPVCLRMSGRDWEAEPINVLHSF